MHERRQDAQAVEQKVRVHLGFQQGDFVEQSLFFQFFGTRVHGLHAPAHLPPVAVHAYAKGGHQNQKSDPEHPPPVKWRFDSEGNFQGFVAPHTVAVSGAHEQGVVPPVQVGVGDGALPGFGPGFVEAFEEIGQHRFFRLGKVDDGNIERDHVFAGAQAQRFAGAPGSVAVWNYDIVQHKARGMHIAAQAFRRSDVERIVAAHEQLASGQHPEPARQVAHKQSVGF